MRQCVYSTPDALTEKEKKDLTILYRTLSFNKLNALAPRLRHNAVIIFFILTFLQPSIQPASLMGEIF